MRRCGFGPRVVLWAAAARFASSLGTPDPSVVDLPPSVAPLCKVYRKAITHEQEQKLWEELQPVLEKLGNKAYAPGGQAMSREDATVRNVCVDLVGFDLYTEVQDVQKQKPKRVPGIAWSPTLLKIVKGIGAELLGEAPDTVRVLEHLMPGYEMHVEAPPFGQAFAAMHLFAPGVVNFDNEAGGESGCCLLPNRAIMHCSGELRWGWRVGESFEPTMRFPKQRKVFDAEYRIGIWFFKFNPNLADRRAITDKIEESVTKQGAMVEQEVRSREASNAAFTLPDSSKYAVQVESESAQRERERLEADRRQRIAAEKAEEEAFAKEALQGVGLLGGDLPRDQLKQSASKQGFKQPKDAATGHNKFEGYREDFTRVTKIIEKVRTKHEAGGGLDEPWMRQELDTAMSSSKTRKADGSDDMGFDPSNPAGSWDDIGNRADHYRKKLRGMNFDAQPTEESLRNSATKMMNAKEDLLGDIQVDAFDPREAARVLQQNREALQRRK